MEIYSYFRATNNKSEPVNITFNRNLHYLYFQVYRYQNRNRNVIFLRIKIVTKTVIIVKFKLCSALSLNSDIFIKKWWLYKLGGGGYINPIGIIICTYMLVFQYELPHTHSHTMFKAPYSIFNRRTKCVIPRDNLCVFPIHS